MGRPDTHKAWCALATATLLITSHCASARPPALHRIEKASLMTLDASIDHVSILVRNLRAADRDLHDMLGFNVERSVRLPDGDDAEPLARNQIVDFTIAAA